MHYYQFNIGDYASSTQHLEPMEDLAYRRMLDLYYSKESPLPKDVEKIARLIRMRSHTDCIAIVLDEFFVEEKDGYHNKGADKVLAKVYKKSEAARKSAEARWNKNKDLQQCERNANASETHSEENADGMLPNTQDPLPNTQDTDNKDPVGDERQPKDNFDFDQVKSIWNEVCSASQIKTTKCNIVSEKAKRQLPKTYAKYCKVKKASGHEPADRHRWCADYFKAVLDRAKGFAGQEGDHSNWKPNLEYATRVNTYDLVMEWIYDKRS